jgi:hypothetical protein
MMSKDHDRKAKLLGKSFGASSGQLRKALLFKFAGQLGLTSCYRCGIEIVNIDDFSMEHKEDWMGSADPVKTFFDLNNIAFSHRSCNSAASGGRNGGKTQCPQGHIYDKDRMCSICQRGYRKSFRGRHPEQDTSEYRRQQGWRK